MNHQALIERSHKQAVEKGFWEQPLTFDMVMALIISEIAEALEAYRKGRVNPDWNDTQAVKESFEVELADAIIRIYDWCGGNNLVVKPVVTNLPFNENEGFSFMILFKECIMCWENNSTDIHFFNILLGTLLSYCSHHNIDIERFILWKLDYNLSRPFKHGKQF